MSSHDMSEDEVEIQAHSEPDFEYEPEAEGGAMGLSLKSKLVPWQVKQVL